MKAFALGRRAKWKDYVDLYFKSIRFLNVTIDFDGSVTSSALADIILYALKSAGFTVSGLSKVLTELNRGAVRTLPSFTLVNVMPFNSTVSFISLLGLTLLSETCILPLASFETV